MATVQESLNPYWGLGQPQAGPPCGAQDDNSSVFLSSSDNSVEVWAETESKVFLPSDSDAQICAFSLRTVRALALADQQGAPETYNHNLRQQYSSARPGQGHSSRSGGPLLWRLFPRCIRVSNEEVCIAAEVSLKAAPSECKVSAVKHDRVIPVRVEFVNDRQASCDDDDQPSRQGRGPGNTSTISSTTATVRRRAANDALQALRSHRPDSELLLIWLTPGLSPGLLFIELHVPVPGSEDTSASMSPAVRSGASTGALASAWYTGYNPIASDSAGAGQRGGAEPSATSLQRNPGGNDVARHLQPLTLSLNHMRVYNLSGPDPLPPGGGNGGANRSMCSSGAMSVVVVPDADMEAEVCGLLALQHQQKPLPLPDPELDMGVAGVGVDDTRRQDPAAASTARLPLEADEVQRYGSPRAGVTWRGAEEIQAQAQAQSEAQAQGLVQVQAQAQAQTRTDGAVASTAAPSVSEGSYPLAAAAGPAPAPRIATTVRSLLASGQSAAVGSGRPLAAEVGAQQPGEGEEDQDDARARERFLWDLGTWLEMSAQAAMAQHVQAMRAAREAQAREYDQAMQMQQLQQAQQAQQQPLQERVLWQLGSVSEVEPSAVRGMGDYMIGEPMPHLPTTRALGASLTAPGGLGLAAGAAAGSPLLSRPEVPQRVPQSALELLGFACSRGWAATSSHIVLGLMDMGHSMAEINAAVQEAHGWSALHLAAASGSAELLAMTGLWRSYGRYGDSAAVQEEWRAMLAAPGPGGLTPLHLAAVLPQPATAAQDLLSTLPAETLSTWFGVTARDGCTPAHYASRAGNSHLNDHALLCLASGAAALDLSTAYGLQEVLPYIGDALSLSNSESSESERASAGGGPASGERGTATSASSSWAPGSTFASPDGTAALTGSATVAAAVGSGIGGHGPVFSPPLWLGQGGGALVQLPAYGSVASSTGGTVAGSALCGDASSGLATGSGVRFLGGVGPRALTQHPPAPTAAAGGNLPRAGCVARTLGEGPLGAGGAQCPGGGSMEASEAWGDQRRSFARGGEHTGLLPRARAGQQIVSGVAGLQAVEVEAWTPEGGLLRSSLSVPPPAPLPFPDGLAAVSAAATSSSTSRQHPQQPISQAAPQPLWTLPQQPQLHYQYQQRLLAAEGQAATAQQQHHHPSELVRSPEPWQSPRRAWPEPSSVVVGLLDRVSPVPSTHGSLAPSSSSCLPAAGQQAQPSPMLGALGLPCTDPNIFCQPMNLDEARQAAWRLVAAAAAARMNCTAPAETAANTLQFEINSLATDAGGLGAGSELGSEPAAQAQLPRSAPAGGVPRLLSNLVSLPVTELSRVFLMRSRQSRQITQAQAQLQLLLQPGCLPAHLLPEHMGRAQPPPPVQPPPSPERQQQKQSSAAAGMKTGAPASAADGPAAAASPFYTSGQEPTALVRPVAEEEGSEERAAVDAAKTPQGRRLQADQESERQAAQATVVAVAAAAAIPERVGAASLVELAAGPSGDAPGISCVGGCDRVPSAALQQPGRQEGGRRRSRHEDAVWAAAAALVLGRVALLSGLIPSSLWGGGTLAAPSAAGAFTWALVGVGWPLLTLPAAAARLAASPLLLQLLGLAVHALALAAFVPCRTASASIGAPHNAARSLQHLLRAKEEERGGAHTSGALLVPTALDLCSALLVGVALRCWATWRQAQQQQQRSSTDTCRNGGEGCLVHAAAARPSGVAAEQLGPPALALLCRAVAAVVAGARAGAGDGDRDDVPGSLIDIRPQPAQEGSAVAGAYAAEGAGAVDCGTAGAQASAEQGLPSLEELRAQGTKGDGSGAGGAECFPRSTYRISSM